MIGGEESFLVHEILFELFFAILERSHSTNNKQMDSVAYFPNDHLMPFDTIWESQ